MQLKRLPPPPMLCYSAQASLVTVLYYAPGDKYNMLLWWPEESKDRIVPLPEGMTPNSDMAPVINADDAIVQVIADDDTTCANSGPGESEMEVPGQVGVGV